MDKRKKNPEITSPKAVFLWPKLDAPDYGTAQFPDPSGSYKVTLRLDESAKNDLEAKLLPHLEAARAEAEQKFAAMSPQTRKKLGKVVADDLFVEEYDKDTEEATGFWLFKLKMPAKGKTRDGKEWNRKPLIFDGKAKPMAECPPVWTGSVGRASFEVFPYFVPGTGKYGVSKRLTGVQLIELRSGQQRSAASMGFEAEEGGYEADDAPAQGSAFTSAPEADAPMDF